MKYIFLLAACCLWPFYAQAQSPDTDRDQVLSSQPIQQRDFDLSQPKEVAKAFLYTANASDYHYLRALCNPFVADYADIAEGKLNEICYWLPRYGYEEGSSLDELKAEFAAMGKYKLSAEPVEITEEGGNTFARIKLEGETSNHIGASMILLKAGPWWFLHRFTD